MVGGVRYLDWCRRRYGDVVTMGTLFDERFVMLFDPGAVKELFQGSGDRLHAGEANALLGPIVGERSVLLLDGAEHLRHRRLLLPPFHGKRMLAHVADDARLRRHRDRPLARRRAVHAAREHAVADAAGDPARGVRLHPRRRARTSSRGGCGRWWSRCRAPAACCCSTPSCAGAASAAPPSGSRRASAPSTRSSTPRSPAAAPTPISTSATTSSPALLLARDEDGVALTDREVRDELLTLLLAGHETTATGLAWTFDLVLHDARVRARAQEGDDRYLDAVVKESLRIRPVIPGVGRVVRERPFAIGGYKVPVGMEINPSIRTIHRRGDLYPNPRAFSPERFLEGRGVGGTGYLHLGAVRRWDPALPGRELRPDRDAGRAGAGARARRPGPVDPELAKGQFRAITLAPKGGVRVRQERPPLARRPGAPRPPISASRRRSAGSRGRSATRRAPCRRCRPCRR